MSTRPSVLIVDDDSEVRTMLAELLVARGLDVEVAANGAEAIELLENGQRPYAVLLDLLMPGIVGHSVIEYMQHDASLASIPVAIMSGTPELAPPGYETFRKPFKLKSVLEFIGRSVPGRERSPS
jgi:CheY-like chemotaxis protein